MVTKWMWRALSPIWKRKRAKPALGNSENAAVSQPDRLLLSRGLLDGLPAESCLIRIFPFREHSYRQSAWKSLRPIFEYASDACGRIRLSVRRRRRQRRVH